MLKKGFLFFFLFTKIFFSVQIEYSKLKNELVCNEKIEDENEWKIFLLSDDYGTGIGDVMPYFHRDSNELFILYLKDIWNDLTNERHPWYGFQTKNFSSYSQITNGELLSSNSDGCSEDYALGTGSIIKKEKSFYAFYTGHNPNSPSICVQRKETILLAISLNFPEKKFEKDLSFEILSPPIGQGFDQENNFRDPFVFYEKSIEKYVLLISARTNRGVLLSYYSSDLYHWIFQGIFYDGNEDYFYMMETPDLFLIDKIYYLLFSDIDSKNVYYRKSDSFNGPWTKPTEHSDRFDGNGFYGAKVIRDNHDDHFILAWNNRYENNEDFKEWKWGGNLIVHKLYQLKPSGDLAITIPHTIQRYFQQYPQSIHIHSQWGDVTKISIESFSYSLNSSFNSHISNLIFDPIPLKRYRISTILSFTYSIKDFGFMFNACDGYEHFYSLRFIPQQHRCSFDQVNRSSLTTSTIPITDVPFQFHSNIDYQIEIIIENSILIAYIQNKVALTARVYRLINNSWGIYVDNSNVTFKDLSITRP